MADISTPSTGISAPLRVPVFRRIWFASVLSNLGLLIQGVGAAWAMMQLTSATEMVALVQTASLLPLMFGSLPAGAIADMYDRRKVALTALTISLVSAGLLSVLAFAGFLSPWLLLVCCFVTGAGMALFSPSWQASVIEQVPVEVLPQAVALNSISYNIARSLGPAVGGVIVAAMGVVAAFAINVVLCLPLLAVLFFWRRVQPPSRFPPERLLPAIAAGLRYVVHSPSIRIVLWRTFLTGVAAGALFALLPVVARDLLAGDAHTFGIILGVFGMGAVIGAVNVAKIRSRVGSESAISIASLIVAAVIVVTALSNWTALTALALLVGGAAWMIITALYNISIQLSAPRWVAGRTLAAFQAAIAGGIAIGSWLWGRIAQDYGLPEALLASAVALAATAFLRRWWHIPHLQGVDHESVDIGTMDIALALTHRSGPIVVEAEYRVASSDARAFYGIMQQVQQTRHRIGAYGWSIARDIADPEIWIERFHCPTWLDYLRMRDRHTAAERQIQVQAQSFHRGEQKIKVRRSLERPFGSVRWKEDAPDRMVEVLPVNSSS